MNPEYKKRLQEAESSERERKARAAADGKSVKIPNMELMPCGCWMWVFGLIALVGFLLYKLMTKTPA